MKHLLLCLLTLASLYPSLLHAEFRNWTNIEGKTVEGELTKVEGDNISLRLRSGKVSTFSQAKLSEADRDYITKNPPAAKPAITSRPPLGSKTPVAAASRKAKWLTKMSKAEEEAKQTGLPILVLFTGSTWCPYCVKLEAEVFAQKEFAAFADDNLVLLKLDFGPGGSTTNKEQAKMQQDYGVRGFPTYFLTDASGAKLAQGGYHGGINPDAFAKWVKGAAPKK